MRFSDLLSDIILIFCFFLVFSIFPVCAAPSSGWQPVNVSSWAQVDIPPGWSYGAVENSTKDPDMVTLEAVSPDKESLLHYVFEKNPDPASPGDLKRSQDRIMGEQGFCVCQLEPQVTENSEITGMKQTYIKGTDQGAVVCSASYPGWGRYQYALIMNGTSAVNDYYEDMPDKLADHIRPLRSGNETVSSKK